MRRAVSNPKELAWLIHELGNLPHPFSVSVAIGRRRTLNQNALAWKWAGEIAAHFGDRTANEVHAHNKLHHGVPIRRECDADFAEVYDAKIKPLPYETKLAIMAPPIDLPVTRGMKVKEMQRFLDAVALEWTGQGVTLTIPEDA